MKKILFKNATLINEEKTFQGDLLVVGERIERIGSNLSEATAQVIDLNGKYLIPGMIDDQVHFREPGLTHKGEISTESAAALAGGITSFMEMPNTSPPTTTVEALEAKFALGAQKSLANYSFYMGASNDNLDEVQKVDSTQVCGLKIFMGASTGNMLVDDPKVLEAHFSQSPMLIATHCEDTPTINANQKKFQEIYGDDIPMRYHGQIRSADACYLSSSLAVELAQKTGARLHVLHLTTAREMELFARGPVEGKQITAEVCVHHLYFNDEDYETKGTHIKWNPAVKTANDRAALRRALLEDRLDIIATDHAPHTLEEKKELYTKAPSGGPLVQHALTTLFEFAHEGWLPVETLVRKACHNPATVYQIKDRGFLREGYFADLVVVDPQHPWTPGPANNLYKCGWSPFDGTEFSAFVAQTWINGQLAWDGQSVCREIRGKRLEFNRE